jgi:hypothetical protein
MFLFTSAMAGVPFLLAHEWATVAPVPLDRSPSHAWMAGPGAREAFIDGGVRALFDRSPMRYDVAIYLGGAP